MKQGQYWASKHLRNQQRRVSSNRAVIKFNERIRRLRACQNNVSSDFVDKILNVVSENEYQTLMNLIHDLKSIEIHIEKNINTAKNSDLSKYATRVKRVAMFSIKMCQKYHVYNDIDQYEYAAKEKSIYVNGEKLYYLG